MGYLNNAIITVDAILTTKGREALASNDLGNDQTFETSGYTATIADVRTLASFEGLGIQSAATTNANATATQTIGTNVSSTVTGTQINLRATTINTLFGTNSTLVTTLTVIGLDSGARITVPVTITKTAV